MGTPPQLESNMGPIVHSRPETESSASLHSKTYHSVETCMYGKKSFSRVFALYVCALPLSQWGVRVGNAKLSPPHNDFPSFCYLFFCTGFQKKLFSFPSRHLSVFLLLGCNRGGLARGGSVKNTWKWHSKVRIGEKRPFLFIARFPWKRQFPGRHA